METTFAGIPSLAFLLKSMILYLLLVPPPLCLTVILPWALRPEFFFLTTVRDFSGVDFVISLKSEPGRGIRGILLDSHDFLLFYSLSRNNRIGCEDLVSVFTG